MDSSPAQPFEAHHQRLHHLVAKDPMHRSLPSHPRACWYRRNGSTGATWELGIALAWDCHSDFTGALIENNKGEVLSLPMDLFRFQPPSAGAPHNQPNPPTT